MRLPDVDGLPVAFDPEGSGLFADDGARVSAVSCAWRGEDGQLQAFATPFDQGTAGAADSRVARLYDPLPLGAKNLPASHARRISKWDPEYLFAPNRTPQAWDYLFRWLKRQKLVMHHAKYDCLMTLAGQRGRTSGPVIVPTGNRLELACGHSTEIPGTVTVGGWISCRRCQNQQKVLSAVPPPWDGGGYNLMPYVVWDTQLAQAVLEPGEPTGLKPTAVRLHLGAEVGIEDGAEAAEEEALAPWKGPKKDPRYDLIPWSVLGPYSKLDAIYTLTLYEHQQDSIHDGAPAWKHVRDELDLMRVLYGMEVAGCGFDSAGCREQERQLGKLIAEAAKRVPFSGGNGAPTYPAAAKFFFGPPADGGQGHLPYNDKRTASGNPQVDEEVIARLVKDGTPGAAEFSTYAELMSARSKWYHPYPELAGRDGRLRTCHRQAHVVSGRLSVERWQAQALPHDYQIPGGIEPIRRFIGEDPASGWEYWEADVSQAEIRLATAVAKEGRMLRALRGGVDSHDAACALMFYGGADPASVKDGPDWEFNRQIAKRCNLGILYGIGAKELSKQIARFTGRVVTVPQTSAWISDWKEAFPRFSRALQDYADMAASNGQVRLVTGRVRRFSDYEPVHKAFNQRIQGDVAETMKLAMTEFDKQYPGMLVLQIHDSLVARIPRERVEEVTAAMQEILVASFARLFRPVPFKADVKPFGRGAYQEA